MLGHSRLHILPETHFLRRIAKDFPLDQPLLPDQVVAVVGRIVMHPRWATMGMSTEQFRDQAIGLNAPLLADVLNLIYHCHLRNAGKARFGDKTPEYIRYIPDILKIYPNARFIHLVRDGRDVTISFANVGWGRAYHGPDFDWTRAVRAALAYRRAPFADRILKIRYEEMVRDLEGAVRRVCAFLGEAFEPDMLNWHGRIGKLFPGEVPNVHTKLFQPVLSEEVTAWRRRLSVIECFLIEASLYRDLEAIGYELRFSGRLWRPLLAPAGAVMHAVAPVLDRVLPALLRRNYIRRLYYL